MQEKYGSKGKKLYFAFVDLEKSSDKSIYMQLGSEEDRSGGMVGDVVAMYNVHRH